MFNLKTDVGELSSINEGTNRMQYDQHPPTRDVTSDNFANGAIHFRWETSGQKWWIPNRTYFRTRFELTKGDGTTQLANADGIAPNMDLMPTLFQSGEAKINNKIVSRVPDFMAQVDALENRLTKSSSWFDTVGEANNWWETRQDIRQQEVTSDGALIKGNEVGTTTTETIDTVIGYDALNSIAYDESKGLVTFAAGSGAAVPDTDVNWVVGDYFAFTTIGGAEEGVLNCQMRVLATAAAATMLVEPIGAVDVAAADASRFSRFRITDAGASASRRIGNFELNWQPPLSLLKVDHAMPSGRYEIVLNPQTAESFQKRAIETVLGAASKTPTLPGGAAADYRLRVTNMYLYVATIEGPRADDITYLLDLDQTHCQAEKIDTTSFAQKNFDVSPSTYALTAAFQDLRAGVHTSISPTKFKSYGAAANPTSVEELKLDRFYINYAGQNLPDPDADPSFEAKQDYTTQRYTETQMYSGAYNDTGGAETIEDFHDRGSYYYFLWPRDGTDRSTRVIVKQEFDAANVVNMRLLLFDHSKQVARIRVQDGRVVDVQLEDV